MSLREDYRARAAWVVDLCRRLYPVRGLVASPDLDRAFAQLKAALPALTIHEYPSGAQAEDWVVPDAWRALSGRLEDRSGRVLASLDESFLFVAPYSQPVDGWFSKAQMAGHVRTRADVPDAYALEHRYAYDYRLKDWGVTLPHVVWQAMPEDGQYRVRIEVERRPGSMKVAEMVLEGRRPETICICSQFDELCNDGQSSAVLGMDLMRRLAQRGAREFTWQLLLVPEMFGTLFYIHANRERVRRTAGMLNLETIGAGERWLHKSSLGGDSLVDHALHLAFADAGVAYEQTAFFGGYGNDERVYGWPTIGIPGASLQRFPFRYYHTSRDTPDILEPPLVEEALRVADAFIDIVERDYVPSWRRKLQPWLTRHGLYFDHASDPEQFQRLNNLALFHIDGRRSVSALARLAGVGFGRLHAYLERFAELGLIAKSPVGVTLPASDY
jgi:aminopeptidase-like protein